MQQDLHGQSHLDSDPSLAELSPFASLAGKGESITDCVGSKYAK